MSESGSADTWRPLLDSVAPVMYRLDSPSRHLGNSHPTRVLHPISTVHVPPPNFEEYQWLFFAHSAGTRVLPLEISPTSDAYNPRRDTIAADDSSDRQRMDANQRLRRTHHHSAAGSSEPGILNERVLLLVFEAIQWDLRVLCLVSSVDRKLRAIAKRLLWRELCAHRAPRMVAALTGGRPGGTRIGGGWPAVAKLMFFCCGAEQSRNFRMGQRLPGHFASSSRFSKTSGRSFLPRRCRGDVLYMSDPCEHRMGKEGHQDDLGVYRGVFKGFSCSMTRACLIGRQAELEDRACPYCGARVWSMTTARLVPRSAARRLGSRNGRLEYFVCVNGHLHGACWLAPLSSDDDDGGCEFDDEEDEDEDSDGDQNGQDAVNGSDDRAGTDGSTSATSEEIVGEWGPTE